MARYTFGGNPSSFATDTRGNVIAYADVTVWDARTGGNQITDLLDADGVAVVAGVVYADADGLFLFSGPDTVTSLYIDSGAGSRLELTSGVADTSGIEARLAVVETDLLAAGGDYLPLAGGTLTGALTLSGAPSTDLHAATKAYVDAAITTALANFPPAIYVSATEPVSVVEDSIWFDISGSLPPDPVTTVTLYDKGYAGTVGVTPTNTEVGGTLAGLGTMTVEQTTPLHGTGKYLHILGDATRWFTVTFTSDQTEVIVRGLLRKNDALASNGPIFMSFVDPAAAIAAQLRLTPTGVLMRDGTTLSSSTVTVAEDTTVRFEWIIRAGIDQTLNIWDSPTSALAADRTLTFTQTANAVTSLHEFKVGVISVPTASISFDLDEIRVDAGTTSIGAA